MTRQHRQQPARQRNNPRRNPLTFKSSKNIYHTTSLSPQSLGDCFLVKLKDFETVTVTIRTMLGMDPAVASKNGRDRRESEIQRGEATRPVESNTRSNKGVIVVGGTASQHQETIPLLPCSAGLQSTNKSPDEILRQLCGWIEKSHGLEGKCKADHFQNAGLQPPITKQSLSELDISAILLNSKLRHDVNFDRELHFRPNLDGSRGRAKTKARKEYISALTAEFELYNFLFRSSETAQLREQPCWRDIIDASQRRLPQLFYTIKDILLHLVPEKDQPSVEEHLDVPMIMQEIEKGVCDLGSISLWVAQLLKAHCAPMRDGIVDLMVEQIRAGVSTPNMAALAKGLNDLLGVLEAMKLVIVPFNPRMRVTDNYRMWRTIR